MAFARLVICLCVITVASSCLIWIAYVQSGVWQTHLRQRIENSFSSTHERTDWVRFHVQGREIVLFGEAPSGDALRAVQALIKTAAGVAKLTSSARVRVWGELAPPTVASLATNARRPLVSGTWSPSAAESMSVELDGRLFVLGEDQALRTEGTTWTLTPGHDLADGVYDVEVTTWSAQLSASDLSDGELTIDTEPPPAPQISRYFGRSLTPQISGEWPIKQASSLRIEVAGRSYSLGKDLELTSDAQGRWTLKVSTPLVDGPNDVVATAFDSVGNGQSDQTMGELIVDREPPPPPTVERFQSSRAFTLTGTWAEGDAVDLEVSVAGQTHRLGKGAALISKTKGRWTYAPPVLPGEGTYDVTVRTRDLAGNVSEDETRDELVIKFVPQRDTAQALEESPRPLTAFMCQRAFRSILQRRRVRFPLGSAKLERQSVNVLDDLAGIAARCPAARIEIGSHTDARGEFSNNQRLTHQRAYAVANHFVRRGIDRGRLTSVGYGEVRPIASNNTAAGREKNDRVELYVKR